MRRDAAQNRRRLLAAAAEVFGTEGVDAGVEEVAQCAGVGMGTLYRHFPTKEVLIGQLVTELLGELVDAAESALSAPDGAGLETLLARTCELQQQHRGCLSRLWESSATDELTARFRGALAGLVEQAQAAGRLRPDVTAADVTVMLWALRGVVEDAGDTAPDAWRRHLELTLAGLRPGGAVLVHPPLSSADLDAATRARREGRRRRRT